MNAYMEANPHATVNETIEHVESIRKVRENYEESIKKLIKDKEETIGRLQK